METTYHAYYYEEQFRFYVVIVETTEKSVVKYYYEEEDLYEVNQCQDWNDEDCKNYMRSNSHISTDTTIL